MKLNRNITQIEVKRLFRYDSKTGNLIRKITIGGGRGLKGRVAGWVDKGYVRVRVNSKTYQAHRLIWLYHNGYIPENMLDHINKNSMDNRIENLREVSFQCNMRNSGNTKHNKSGVRGINWDSYIKKWRAQIMVMQKSYSLGAFKDFTEAVCHRLAAEQCLDWPSCDDRSPAQEYVEMYLSKIKQAVSVNQRDCTARDLP